MDINHPISEYFYNPNDPESSETGFFYQPRPDKKSQIQDDIVFNDNDELRKGYNVVLQNGKKVASFGISKWGDVEEDPKDFLKLPEKKSFPNSIFFWGGFVVHHDSKEKGIGKSIIRKIFEDAKVDNIFLYAAGYQEAVPFWMKIGGEVLYKQEDDDGIYYIRLERNKVLSNSRMLGEIVQEEMDDYFKKEIGLIKLDNETFYHQTNRANAESILQNGFTTHMHDGQARYTHGVYFLKHDKASYGNTTLATTISGNFIDLTDDPFGDEWIALRDSVEWNNHIDLTVKLREKFPAADGIVFANRYLLVVWYPERCVKNVQIL